MSRGRAVHAEFAVRFRQALDEAGYGACQLKELGTLFNVSAQAVRKWLDGDAMPVSKRAPGVAGILGVRRAWLLDGELPMRPLPATAEKGKDYSRDQEGLSISGEEFKLIANYRKLPRNLQSMMGMLMETTQQTLNKR